MYLFFLFFFFNDTATTEIYTLSLHDALPICHRVRSQKRRQVLGIDTPPPRRGLVPLQQPLVDPVRHRRGRDLTYARHALRSPVTFALSQTHRNRNTTKMGSAQGGLWPPRNSREGYL